MLENFDPSSYIAIFRKDLVPNIRESLEGVVARLEQKIHQSKSPTESINLFSATMRLITELGNDKIINYYLISILYYIFSILLKHYAKTTLIIYLPAVWVQKSLIYWEMSQL